MVVGRLKAKVRLRNAAPVVERSVLVARLVRIVEAYSGRARKNRANPRVDGVMITNRSRGASEILNHLKGDLKVLQRDRLSIFLTLIRGECP